MHSIAPITILKQCSQQSNYKVAHLVFYVTSYGFAFMYTKAKQMCAIFNVMI